MDGIHDLGGRHGFGASLRQRDEGVFHDAWEQRVFAIVSLLLGNGSFVVDEFRHSLERLDPVAYLSDGYYGRWLGGIELLVAEAVVVDFRAAEAAVYPQIVALQAEQRRCAWGRCLR